MHHITGKDCLMVASLPGSPPAYAYAYMTFDPTTCARGESLGTRLVSWDQLLLMHTSDMRSQSQHEHHNYDLLTVSCAVQFPQYYLSKKMWENCDSDPHTTSLGFTLSSTYVFTTHLPSLPSVCGIREHLRRSTYHPHTCNCKYSHMDVSRIGIGVSCVYSGAT